jgi:hypothetical protein
MAIGTYAALDNESKVFDIVQMDILDNIAAPYPDVVYIRVGEPTPTTVPNIGQKWDGDNNQFI